MRKEFTDQFFWELYPKHEGTANDIKNSFDGLYMAPKVAQVAGYCLSKWRNVDLNELILHLPNEYVLTAIGRRGPEGAPAISSICEHIEGDENVLHKIFHTLREISTSVEDMVLINENLLFSGDLRIGREIMRWIGSIARKTPDTLLNAHLKKEKSVLSLALRLVSASTIDANLETRRHAFVTIQNFNPSNVIASTNLQTCLTRILRQLPYLGGSLQAEALKAVLAISKTIDLKDDFISNLYFSAGVELSFELAIYLSEAKTIPTLVESKILNDLESKNRRVVEVALLSIGPWAKLIAGRALLKSLHIHSSDDYLVWLLIEALNSADIEDYVEVVEFLTLTESGDWIRRRMVEIFGQNSAIKPTYFDHMASEVFYYNNE